MTDPFSCSYQEARRAFREAAKRIDAQLDAHVLQAGSSPDDDLTIDVASVGATNPLWSLVVSSGLHGVEGFFGSAAQVAYLSNISVRDVVHARGQLLFLHALNPFGFANHRRVNEDNVDLNRNFLLPNEPYQIDSPAYAKLSGFLNPEGAPRRFDLYLPEVLWRIARVGLPTLKQVVAEGQFAFPRGIFFGGHQAALSTKIVQRNMMQWVQGRHAVHLDFHTGLGEYAKYKLLVTSPRSCGNLALYKELYGPEVQITVGPGVSHTRRREILDATWRRLRNRSTIIFCL
jgi:hypothetical protein